MEESPLRLTPREHDVLELLAEGHDISSIAATLMVSPATVRTHLRSAHTRLGARSRPHAVALALVRGLIEPRERLEPGRLSR